MWGRDEKDRENDDDPVETQKRKSSFLLWNKSVNYTKVFDIKRKQNKRKVMKKNKFKWKMFA